MRIRVIAIGQRLASWVEAGCAEYVTRMPREWNFEVVTLKSAPRVEGKPIADAMRAEARAIEASIPQGFWRIALDERECHVDPGRDTGARHDAVIFHK